jgi:hypothetical protein
VKGYFDALQASFPQMLVNRRGRVVSCFGRW